MIFLILHTGDSNQIQLANPLIKSSVYENHLGVKFYYQLTFDQHVIRLCKKANAKLRAFARVVRYMRSAKKKFKMNSFFAAQFDYCPLMWNNKRAKNVYKRCLRLIYNDKTSSYKDIQNKNIQNTCS